MSKIAEQKALEAYPISISKDSIEEGFDWNEEYREVYSQGYDQALQDFLEKAYEWLSKQPMSRPVFWAVEDFKNYMQDEM